MTEPKTWSPNAAGMTAARRTLVLDKFEQEYPGIAADREVVRAVLDITTYFGCQGRQAHPQYIIDALDCLVDWVTDSWEGGEWTCPTAR